METFTLTLTVESEEGPLPDRSRLADLIEAALAHSTAGEALTDAISGGDEPLTISLTLDD